MNLRAGGGVRLRCSSLTALTLGAPRHRGGSVRSGLHGLAAEQEAALLHDCDALLWPSGTKHSWTSKASTVHHRSEAPLAPAPACGAVAPPCPHCPAGTMPPMHKGTHACAFVPAAPQPLRAPQMPRYAPCRARAVCAVAGDFQSFRVFRCELPLGGGTRRERRCAVRPGDDAAGLRPDRQRGSTGGWASCGRLGQLQGTVRPPALACGSGVHAWPGVVCRRQRTKSTHLERDCTRRAGRNCRMQLPPSARTH